MQAINCQLFKDNRCLHQAAPRRMFGSAYCILVYKETDPRVIEGCALRVEYPRPEPPTQYPPPFNATKEFFENLGRVDKKNPPKAKPI